MSASVTRVPGRISKRTEIIVFIGMLVVAMWLAALVLVRHEQREAIDGTRADLTQLTAAVEHQVVGLVKLTEASFYAVRNWVNTYPSRRPDDDPSFLGLTARLKSLSEAIREIRVVDAGAEPESNGQFAVRVKEGTFYISRPVRTEGSWSATASYPFTAEGGARKLVVVELSLQKIMAIFDEERIAPDGSITVLLADGTTLMRAKEPAELGKSVAASSDFTQHFNLSQHGFFETPGLYDKARRYVYFRHAAHYPFIVAATDTVRHVLANSAQEGAAIFGLVICVTIGSILFTQRLLRTTEDSDRRLAMLKASEAELEYLAHHDPLTDLPNRFQLRSRLHRALARARRDGTKGAVLFVDLDHFKHLNDSMGHAVGDELLRMVAQRLRGRLRETDTLARMGGDEFVVILEHLKDAATAAVAAQSLIDELAHPFRFVSGQEAYIGASIGISVFPDDAHDIEQVVRNADAAMYKAKADGRNRFYFYTSSLTRAANARVHLEVALRQALDRGELTVHYQPLVTLDGLRAGGVEALARWDRPGEGLVPPLAFIPLAEETGLIVPLGEQILRMACKQMRDWLDQGLDLKTLAVNLSAHQLKHPRIGQMVCEALDDAGLPASYLELEITETSLISVGQGVQSVLADLKSTGVRLSIDDFGTGYSCLSYLKDMPIDKLKIDRSFVRDLVQDRADLQIVTAIIGLARTLGLEVLAEGVETDAQLALLRKLNCDCAQGYLFSAPLPAPELACWIGHSAAGAGFPHRGGEAAVQAI